MKIPGKVAVLGVLLLSLTALAQAASYGTLYATLGNYTDRAEPVSTTTDPGGTYVGAYSMTFDSLTLDNPSATASFMWGNSTQNVFCIDPFQYVYGGVRCQYVIHDLQDGPTPLYGSMGGMGPTKAGQIATLLNNAGLASATPSAMTAREAAALGLAVWEIVAEPTANDGSTWDVNGGMFQLFSAPDGLAAAATADLNALKAAAASGTDFSTIGTSPYYALIRPNADGQDFVTAIGVRTPPVPEPLTIGSAFLATCSLGLYIRKRVKAGSSIA
jgi:hypothetical protein